MGEASQSKEHVRQFFTCFIYVLARMPDGGAEAFSVAGGHRICKKKLRVKWKIESGQSR